MSFNTILIPVDFTVNTRLAIAKGIQLCEGPNPEIHLLHVQSSIESGLPGCFRNLVSYFNDEHEQHNFRLQQRLEECVTYIHKLKNNINTCYQISYSTFIEKAIADRAKEIAADLIIIGKNSQHSLFPFLNTVVPNRLAKRTGISVLTVKPGALFTPLRTVVVPISSKNPESKTTVINELRKKFYLNIRLLLLVQKGDDREKLQASLVNTCCRLQESSLDTIRYEILPAGKNNRDILRYCRQVDADLLIVHPETETKIGWLNKHISDEIPVNSRTQVLAV
jgi:nucleotide-binding universal stress UspA family protein